MGTCSIQRASPRLTFLCTLTMWQFYCTHPPCTLSLALTELESSIRHLCHLQSTSSWRIFVHIRPTGWSAMSASAPGVYVAPRTRGQARIERSLLAKGESSDDKPTLDPRRGRTLRASTCRDCLSVRLTCCLHSARSIHKSSHFRQAPVPSQIRAESSSKWPRTSS